MFKFELFPFGPHPESLKSDPELERMVGFTKTYKHKEYTIDFAQIKRDQASERAYFGYPAMDEYEEAGKEHDYMDTPENRAAYKRYGSIGDKVVAQLTPLTQKALSAIPRVLLYGVADVSEVSLPGTRFVVEATVLVNHPFSEGARHMMFTRFGLQVLWQDYIEGDRVGEMAEARVLWAGEVEA